MTLPLFVVILLFYNAFIIHERVKRHFTASFKILRRNIASRIPINKFNNIQKFFSENPVYFLHNTSKSFQIFETWDLSGKPMTLRKIHQWLERYPNFLNNQCFNLFRLFRKQWALCHLTEIKYFYYASTNVHGALTMQGNTGTISNKLNVCVSELIYNKRSFSSGKI